MEVERNIRNATAFLEIPSLAPDENKFSPAGSLGIIRSVMGDKAMKYSTKMIIKYADEVLFIKHRDWPEGWVLPGGTVERGETPQDCIIREIKEEIRLIIPQTQKIGELQFDKEFLTVFEYTKMNKGGVKVDGKEAIESKWFKISDLPSNLGTRTKQVIALWLRQ